MSKNTNITIGTHFENFIYQQIEKGRFSSTSKAIRAGLQLLEEQETKIKALRSELFEREKSGTASYSQDEFINEIDEE